MIRTSYETIKYIDLTKQYIVIKLCRVTSWGFLDLRCSISLLPSPFLLANGGGFKTKIFTNRAQVLNEPV